MAPVVEAALDVCVDGGLEVCLVFLRVAVVEDDGPPCCCCCCPFAGADGDLEQQGLVGCVSDPSDGLEGYACECVFDDGARDAGRGVRLHGEVSAAPAAAAAVGVPAVLAQELDCVAVGHRGTHSAVAQRRAHEDVVLWGVRSRRGGVRSRASTLLVGVVVAAVNHLIRTKSINAMQCKII